jgi:hypothetical protein
MSNMMNLLQRSGRTLVRIQRCDDVRLLNRAARLFLVWGNRRLADCAHGQSRRALVEKLMRA